MRSMENSPFYKLKKNEFKREQTMWERLHEYTTNGLEAFFLAAIPSDDIKSMAPKYMYPIGVIVLVVLCSIFIAVFVPSYLSQLKLKFLVPAGTGQESLCDPVPISNSGQFSGTKTGSWIGGTGFSYSEAAYQLTISNLLLSEEEYKDRMDSIYESLVEVGTIAEANDLGANLLFWMALAIVDNINAQRFNMVGSPLVVFDRQQTFGTLSNVEGDCDASAYSTYDQSTGELILQYKYNEFMLNPKCNTTAYPPLLGYTYMNNADFFEIKIDIRTLITSVAVNFGVLDVYSLQEITSNRDTFLDDTTLQIHNVSSYTNPKFPGMAPITCVLFNGAQHCVLQVGDTYVLPIYNHVGANLTMPEVCNCTTLTHDDLADKYNPCNVFNFLTGFIFWNDAGGSHTPLFELVVKYGNWPVNQKAFVPSYIGSAWGRNSPHYETILNTPGYRQSAYAFCNSTVYGACSIMSFTSFDTTVTNWAVSDYFYSIPNGACRDTFSTTEAFWDDLITTPFAPLTQGYEECRSSPSQAFIDQAGISAGNVTLLSPFGVIFVLLLIVIYQRMTGRVIPKTYSKSEKDSALDALAVALLIARDERMKPPHVVQRSRDVENLAGTGGTVGTGGSGGGSDDDNEAYNGDKNNNVRLTEMVTRLVDELALLAETTSTTYKKEAIHEAVSINWSELCVGRKKKYGGSITGSSGGGGAVRTMSTSSNNGVSNDFSSDRGRRFKDNLASAIEMGTVRTDTQHTEEVLQHSQQLQHTVRGVPIGGLIILNAPLSTSAQQQEIACNGSSNSNNSSNNSVYRNIKIVNVTASTGKTQWLQEVSALYSHTMMSLDQLVNEFKQAYVSVHPVPVTHTTRATDKCDLTTSHQNGSTINDAFSGSNPLHSVNASQTLVTKTMKKQSAELLTLFNKTHMLCDLPLLALLTEQITRLQATLESAGGASGVCNSGASEISARSHDSDDDDDDEDDGTIATCLEGRISSYVYNVPKPVVEAAAATVKRRPAVKASGGDGGTAHTTTGACVSSTASHAGTDGTTVNIGSVQLLKDLRKRVHGLFKSIYTLMVLHTSLVMDCEITSVYPLYGDRVAYNMNQEMYTMAVLKQRLGTKV